MTILRRFKIEEISAVTSPAQKHARALITKSDNMGDSRMQRSTILQKLDAMAEDHSAETSQTFAKSYEDVLLTDEGRRLYAQFVKAPKPPSEMPQHQVEKSNLSPAETELDRLAKARAEGELESYAVAYDAVLKTDKGRELYRRIRHES